MTFVTAKKRRSGKLKQQRKTVDFPACPQASWGDRIGIACPPGSPPKRREGTDAPSAPSRVERVRELTGRRRPTSRRPQRPSEHAIPSRPCPPAIRNPGCCLGG